MYQGTASAGRCPPPLPLADETVVIPGHGEITTIGREKQFNYFLQGLR